MPLLICGSSNISIIIMLYYTFWQVFLYYPTKLSHFALMLHTMYVFQLLFTCTVTRTTTMLHQCSKPELNKTRCERGTWSLYPPVPWLLMASRYLRLARTNWSQTERFENCCGVHFVPQGSSSFSLISLCHVVIKAKTSEYSEILWPSYCGLDCLIHLVCIDVEVCN